MDRGPRSARRDEELGCLRRNRSVISAYRGFQTLPINGLQRILGIADGSELPRGLLNNNSS
jgi:hypothetical protein